MIFMCTGITVVLTIQPHDFEMSKQLPLFECIPVLKEDIQMMQMIQQLEALSVDQVQHTFS